MMGGNVIQFKVKAGTNGGESVKRHISSYFGFHRIHDK